jgi:hypothetical protein
MATRPKYRVRRVVLPRKSRATFYASGFLSALDLTGMTTDRLLGTMFIRSVTRPPFQAVDDAFQRAGLAITMATRLEAQKYHLEDNADVEAFCQH